MTDELQECLAALYICIDESVAGDVDRIVTAAIVAAEARGRLAGAAAVREAACIRRTTYDHQRVTVMGFCYPRSEFKPHQWSALTGEAAEEVEGSVLPHRKQTPTSRWKIRLICCGRDDGEMFFESWEAADSFRGEYTSGVCTAEHGYSATAGEDGHRRAGIVEHVGPQGSAAEEVDDGE